MWRRSRTVPVERSTISVERSTIPGGRSGTGSSGAVGMGGTVTVGYRHLLV
jgi:stress response protein YsnF